MKNTFKWGFMLLGLVLSFASCNPRTSQEKNKKHTGTLQDEIIGKWELYCSDGNPLFLENCEFEKYYFFEDSTMSTIVDNGRTIVSNMRYMLASGKEARKYTQDRDVMPFDDKDTILLVKYPEGEELGEITARFSKLSEDEFTLILLNLYNNQDSLIFVDHYRRLKK